MGKTYNKNRHAGHRERMRERFEAGGFDNYRPHEVIEQLLFEVLPRVNTNPIAHDLIDRFGSVMGVLRAPIDELCKVDGVGIKTAEYIASVIPAVNEAIAEQYRSMNAVSHEMAVFLIDWFMSAEPRASGIIVCDKNGVFSRFTELNVNEEMDVDILADGVCAAVGEGKYIIAFNDADAASRSFVYRLLDRTAAHGAIMTNAYIRNGAELQSLLFVE